MSNSLSLVILYIEYNLKSCLQENGPKGGVIIEVPQYHPLSLENESQRGPKSCKMTSERSVCKTSHSSKAYMQPRYIY